MFQNVNSVEYSFKTCEEDTNVDVYIVDQSGKSLSASNGWSTKWYQTIDFVTLHTTHWPSAKLVAGSAAENVCANSCTPGVNTWQNWTKMIKNVGLEHGIFGDRWVQIDHFMQVSTIRAHSMTLKFMVRSIFFRTNKELCFPNWRNHAIGFRIFFFAPPGFSTVADCKGPPRTPAGCLPAKKKKHGGAFFKNNAQITCWSKFVIASHKDIAPDDVMLHDSLCNIKPIGTFVPHAVYQWMSATASNRPATHEEAWISRECYSYQTHRKLIFDHMFFCCVQGLNSICLFQLKKYVFTNSQQDITLFWRDLRLQVIFLRSLNQAFGTPQPKYRDPSR